MQANSRPQPSERLRGVSTEEQDTDPELDELRAAGCDTVREESMPPAPILPGRPAGAWEAGRRASERLTTVAALRR